MTRHVSVTLEFQINTGKAMGFLPPEAVGIIWLPHSQIRNLDAILDADPGYREKVEVEIPAWLSEKNSLDPYCEELEDEVY